MKRTKKLLELATSQPKLDSKAAKENPSSVATHDEKSDIGETDSLISEDKSSGSEYIPDTSSDSSTKSKTKEWWEEENTNVNSGSAAQIVENWLEKNNKPVSKTALVKNNSEKETKKIKILQNVIIKSETNKKAQVIEREEENLTTGESMSDVNSGITFSISEKINGKRIRNKRNWCPYCLNAFQNMARHFEQRHENEIDVAKVLAMKKRSKERKEAFSYIIRAGNFSHNCEVLSCKKGELVLVRRPAEIEAVTYTFAEFGPCPNCLGFMVKKQLYHHIRTCQHKPKDIFIGKNIVSESNAIMHGIMKADLPPSYTHHILSKIRDDKIGKCCVNDSLIIKFGAMQYEKYHNTQAELIRQTMRQLGRLLLELRLITPNQTLSLNDFLRPDKFDLIVKATQSLCAASYTFEKRPQFNTPSLALKLGGNAKEFFGKKLQDINVEDLPGLDEERENEEVEKEKVELPDTEENREADMNENELDDPEPKNQFNRRIGKNNKNRTKDCKKSSTISKYLHS
ncbi:hypothetical protein RN001_003041 [Aquatica leii]|uniref:Uncharacterized protein n=1 Tax=Aquatica leii TaxID=1421715 RepID=A0AAN7SSY4_9COLE|nr:hypothetical protein RN001_003041 [Aquatica leii]